MFVYAWACVARPLGEVRIVSIASSTRVTRVVGIDGRMMRMGKRRDEKVAIFIPLKPSSCLQTSHVRDVSMVCVVCT